MHVPTWLAAFIVLCAPLSAQTPLTTVFDATNFTGPGGGGAVLFDLTVHVPLSVYQIDCSAYPLGILGGLDILSCPNTRTGNETNPAVWTLRGTASGTTADWNIPSAFTFAAPITLTPGSYGIMLRSSSSWSHGLTTGNVFNLDYANNELRLVAGAAQSVPFGSPSPVPYVPNVSIHYQSLPWGSYALAAPFGSGCTDSSRTFYELFAPGAFDLNGQAMTLINQGTSYRAVAGGSFVAPSWSAIDLNLTDDSETTITLANPFPILGGTTSSLVVCSNGFVSVASGNSPGGFEPSAVEWCNSAQQRWGEMHDYYPVQASSPVGPGAVKFHSSGSVAYVTWDQVQDYYYQSSGSNTWQLQFDTSNGNVTYVWQSISALGNGHLVGYAAQGLSNPVAVDISAGLSSSFATSTIDAMPLRLSANARPLLGTSISLITQYNNNALLGFNVLSFTQVVPRLSLDALGAPGCFQWVATDCVSSYFTSGGTGSNPLSIPNAPVFAGVDVFSQSASVQPGTNALGITTSNGLKLHLNTQ